MVSVCMATYNGGRFLKEQIDSILSQLSINDELIVSDDGSTDDTISILKSYNDSRIKIYYNLGRQGCNANFENALKHAIGDYIFLSDQDDVWVEGKVNKCLEILQSVDLVVHDCFVVDSNLKIIEQSFFKRRKSKSGLIHNLICNSYVGACMAFKKSVLLYSLPIPPSLLIYHDGWIASLVDCLGKISYVDIPLIYYRRHNLNTSQTARKSKFSKIHQLKYRLQWFFLLIGRMIKVK